MSEPTFVVPDADAEFMAHAQRPLLATALVLLSNPGVVAAVIRDAVQAAAAAQVA